MVTTPRRRVDDRRWYSWAFAGVTILGLLWAGATWGGIAWEWLASGMQFLGTFLGLLWAGATWGGIAWEWLASGMQLLGTSPFPLGFFPFGVALAYGVYRWRRYAREKVAHGVRLQPMSPEPTSSLASSPVIQAVSVGGGTEALLMGVRSSPSEPSANRTVSLDGDPVPAPPTGSPAPPHPPPGVPPPQPSVPTPPTQNFGLRLTLFFALIVGPLLWFSSFFFYYYDAAVATVGRLLFWPLPWPGTANRPIGALPPDFIFLMYIAAMFAYLVAIGTTRKGPYASAARATAVTTLLTYVGLAILLEALLDTLLLPSFLSSLSLLVRAFVGGIFFTLLIFATVVVPPPMAVEPRLPPDRTASALFFGTAAAAVASASLLLYTFWFYFGLGRDVLAFALLLLLPIYSLSIWGGIGRAAYAIQVRRRPMPAVRNFHPPVTIVIPAYNEATNIAAAVRSADRAAALYPGITEVLVGNDGSTDRTSELARATMAQLEHARGRVLDLPHGGKSHALNAMLRAATGTLLVRIDGDSRISGSSGFAAIVRHFADPEVGGVQGMILPLQTDGWTRKLRFMEIAWNHMFLRRAQMALRATQVVDGAFCAFRRRDLLAVGGWVGWNGEDTEVTLRLQRLGFRMRYEPDAVAFEDVPASFAQLKKQRVRWTRGGMFAHLRHYGALFADRAEFGGLAMVFWLTMFARGGMRQMIYVYALLATLLLHLPTLLHLGIIVALLFIPRAIVIAAYTLKMRWYRATPWLGLWPVASVVKQYFTTEALGTMLPGAIPEFSE